MGELISKVCLKNWLAGQDSNLRMPESKSGALPLGDRPPDIEQFSRVDYLGDQRIAKL